MPVCFLQRTTTGVFPRNLFDEASTPANFADPVYPASQLDCLFYYVVKNASKANRSLLFRHLRLNNNRRYTKFQKFRAIFNNLNKLW
jgi:hypothetical protein